MDESSFNMAVRKFLKEVGVTSQREIERVVREGKVEGDKLKLRMTLRPRTRHSIILSKQSSTLIDRIRHRGDTNARAFADGLGHTLKDNCP